jgi:hypothetical protein
MANGSMSTHTYIYGTWPDRILIFLNPSLPSIPSINKPGPHQHLPLSLSPSPSPETLSPHTKPGLRSLLSQLADHFLLLSSTPATAKQPRIHINLYEIWLVSFTFISVNSIFFLLLLFILSGFGT